MNKVLFSVLFSLLVCTASSQRIYFIYLQTESQQPFFVKLDEKIHSSSATGYLILSRLKDSTYNLILGFNGQGAGEQKFTCVINRKDHGYLVKNFGDKGWGLVDLQTSSVQMASGDNKKDVSVVTAPVNAFTDLLAKAADDSTLKQLNVLPEEKKAEQTAIRKDDVKELSAVKPEEKNTKAGNATKDSAVVPAAVVLKQKEDSKETGLHPVAPKTATPDVIKLAPVTLPADTLNKKTAGIPVRAEEKKVENPVGNSQEDKTVQPYLRSKVIRKAESSTTEGLGLTYIDTYADGSQDTIRLMIPNETKIQFAASDTKDSVEKKINTQTVVADPVIPDSSPAAVKSSIKNSCKGNASDDDFYKLRKKMAGGKSDADMINEAKKSFRSKCFTTGQIKNLGALFIGDGGKYNFFDAAYPHISDTENFASLQTELKDAYFISRFKAMVH